MNFYVEKASILLTPTTTAVGVKCPAASVCLRVCSRENSKTNDPKVFKHAIGDDLGITYM